uniref:Uncharacterized protein n=1 Tax=Anopheles culicifacies TaxID=139723 RepID=A0A182ME85_9DIPT
MSAAEKCMNSYLRKKQLALNIQAEDFQAKYDDSQVVEVPVRLQLVDECQIKFQSVMDKIEDLDASNLSDPAQVQEQSDFHTQYCKVKGFLLHHFCETSGANSSVLNATLRDNGSNIHLKLPKIVLATTLCRCSASVTLNDTGLWIVVVDVRVRDKTQDTRTRQRER